MSENIFEDIIYPKEWRLDISGMVKGIDNYHVDVRLSKHFCSDLKVLISELIRRETDTNRFQGDPGKAFVPLSRSYLDMMTVLIHRIKTDLPLDQVAFLQFSVCKHILDSVTKALNNHITETKKQVADLRNQGSMQVLRIQHQLASITKRYNETLYRVNKQIFENIHRTEYRNLRVIREQYMAETGINFEDFLLNTLLLNKDL